MQFIKRALMMYYWEEFPTLCWTVLYKAMWFLFQNKSQETVVRQLPQGNKTRQQWQHQSVTGNPKKNDFSYICFP